MTLTEQEANDLFDYATSIVHDMSLFIDEDILGKELAQRVRTKNKKMVE